MKNVIKENKIVAILRNIPSEKILNIIEIAYLEGIKVFEVSLMSRESFNQIEQVKKYFGSKIIIGAGTVINTNLAEDALNVGADFLFSPSSDEKVLDFCKSKSIKIIPGVFSPSDISLCLSYGYSLLKLFPANIFPISYIKELKGPFPQTEYLAVGGVNENNYKDFLNSGFLGVGLSSSLFPKELVIKSDWDGIKNNISKYKLVNNVNG